MYGVKQFASIVNTPEGAILAVGGTDERVVVENVSAVAKKMLTRIVEDLDAARDRAAVTQEELSSHLSEQTNKRLYVLSVVAAIFLPLGLLTGLLGANVGGMPYATHPQGFLILSGALVVVVALEVLFFRLKGWL